MSKESIMHKKLQAMLVSDRFTINNRFGDIYNPAETEKQIRTSQAVFSVAPATLQFLSS